MNNISNIKDFKQIKKLKVITSDLKMILKIFNLTITALKHYSNYVMVMEIISIIQNNKTLVEIQYNKYNKKLGEENGQLEKNTENDTDPSSTIS